MPILLKRIVVLVFFSLLLVACRKEERQAGPQVIYVGLGVSNSLEIGMTIAQIGKQNRDIEAERHYAPDASFWKRLFTKPMVISARIPSRGATFVQLNEHWGVESVAFSCAAMPPSVLRNGSNEVYFDGVTIVRREQVVSAFGPPRFSTSGTDDIGPVQRHVIELARGALHSDPMVVEWVNRGESISWTNGSSETLSYPKHGVSLMLEDGIVSGINVFEKFGGTNAPARP